MQQPTIHHYFAKVAVPGSASDSIPSTPKAGALNLKPLSSELSEALDLQGDWPTTHLCLMPYPLFYAMGGMTTMPGVLYH